MNRALFCFGLASIAVSGAVAQGWQSYGGNAQHSGGFTGASQSGSLIQWQAPLDDGSSYFGAAVLTHYAGTMITPANTVVYAYRYTTTVANKPDNDNWAVMARNGATGALLWRYNTDFNAAVLAPADWTSVFPATLVPNGNTPGVAMGGLAGSVWYRKTADVANLALTRLVFYTTVADFNANSAAYAPITIATPITADGQGNLYFGYIVKSAIPTKLSALGNGGIAKINVTTGKSSFVSASSLKLAYGISTPAINSAPAITTDGKFLYEAFNGAHPTMVKLATKDLTLAASAQIFDPSVANGDASLPQESSASPMIGPDGHVFMGVFGNGYRESHGWMAQFDANLNPNDSKGKRLPWGAFGWDDTAVVVPTKIVPSYYGKAPYLILTKYNNYNFSWDPLADGSNKVAVLDPSSDSITVDRQSGIHTMNEVLTVLGVTKTNDDTTKPNAVNEWCINSAAVDINRKSAIVNSEDGHMYRWSFVTNTLTEALDLQPPTGEAYTMTSIGPDGQLYAINNTILFAVGSTKPTSVSRYAGSAMNGGIVQLTSRDQSYCTITSAKVGTLQEAGVEADFKQTAKSPTELNVVVDCAGTNGAAGSVLAYNYKTKHWDSLGTADLSKGYVFHVNVPAGAANYVGPTGITRVVALASIPISASPAKFSLLVDQITCNAK